MTYAGIGYPFRSYSSYFSVLVF